MELEVPAVSAPSKGEIRVSAGGRVLTWVSRHYIQVTSLFGLSPQISAGRDSLPILLQADERREYKSGGVFVYGTQVENSDFFPQQSALASEWNKVHTFPKLCFAGFSEAMGYVAGQLGDSIPGIRGNVEAVCGPELDCGPGCHPQLIWRGEASHKREALKRAAKADSQNCRKRSPAFFAL